MFKTLIKSKFGNHIHNSSLKLCIRLTTQGVQLILKILFPKTKKNNAKYLKNHIINIIIKISNSI